MSTNKLAFPIVLAVAWALMLVLTLLSFAGFTNTTAHTRATLAQARDGHAPPAGRAPHHR